jgi:hypothetical protein
LAVLLNGKKIARWQRLGLSTSFLLLKEKADINQKKLKYSNEEVKKYGKHLRRDAPSQGWKRD